MFDNYYPFVEKTIKSGPKKIDVTIKRQSTSDDARLLKDLQDEAMKSLTNAVVSQLKDNDFEFVSYKIAHDMRHLKTYLLVMFKLNGHPYNVKIEHEPSKDDDDCTRCKKGIEAISKALTREILLSISPQEINEIIGVTIGLERYVE